MSYAFVDIPDGTEVVLSIRNPSLQNLKEAIAVSQVAMFMAKALSLSQSRRDIAILTFYSAQVQCIQNALETCRCDQVEASRIQVMTVDSFQGSEADVVLISFVRANAKASVGFLKDFQRLNVALTRAKHSLILFGSAATLESCGLHMLANLVGDAKKRGFFFSFAELSGSVVGV